MIQSMTGFGRAALEYGNKKIVVEIKSLNSKQTDISTRIASIYKEKEIEIRNELSLRLERGKIDFSLLIENAGKSSAAQINQPVVEAYYEQIKSISKNLGIKMPENCFETILKMPDALKTETLELDENEWNEILRTTGAALEQLREFRTQEGMALKKVFETKIKNIKNLLEKISPFEAERIEKIKSRLEENLQSIFNNVEYDENRLEQEMIFYIEKLDVNEEKVRLRNHLDYFIETIDIEQSSGKKLGFIAQEIGREINTLGSKANHGEMQKLVILMKDELEQIKEQILNVL